MNDQPSLRGFSDSHAVLSQQTGHGHAPDMNDQNRKRFHRGVARQTASSQVVTQLPSPASPARTGFSAPSLVPSRVMTPATPARDEWESLRLVPQGVRRHFLSGAPLVNFFRRDPAAKAFDLLRTRLLQTLRANGWNRIAIAAPTHGCGATFTAVNLAQSLARIPGSRTVLMDINHRSPGIAEMLDMQGIGDMRGYLAGEVAMERHLMRASKTLALGLAAGPEQNAAEILHDAQCQKALSQMTKALRPDVVLYDLPPILAYDDLAAFLPNVDGVLLVADGTQTLARHMAACEDILKGQTQLLGVILNQARKSGLENYNT